MPQAGSQITSSAFGSISSTIMRIIWRGVRNWPLRPDWLILLSRYS